MRNTNDENFDRENLENTSDFDALPPENYGNGQTEYNPNEYNSGGYNQSGYKSNGSGNGRYYPPEKKKTNTPYIVAVSILSSVIVIGIVIIICMLTGVINFGGKKDDIAVAGKPVSTSTPAPAPAPTPSPTFTATPQPAENNIVSRNVYVSNVNNSVYLRSAPVEDSGNIICEIPLGTQVGFIENADSTFAKVNYNGQIGYVKQQYLSEVKPSVKSENNTVQSYVYVANVKNSIYFRSAPSENDGNIICEIPLGTMVGFIENADSVFAKINYNGQIGYAKRVYLSNSKPSNYSSYSSSTMTVVNVDYAIYLRSSPSESSDSNIIMEIPVGATVTYLGTANSTFYKISYQGTVGYSKQIYLSFN